jgi:hypothetical protein
MSGKNTERARIREAYIQMAKVGKYRPYNDEGEIEDQKHLDDEATKYADEFIKTEDAGGDFHIGISDFKTNRGLVYIIEAAGLLCAGNMPIALKLLEMAIQEVRQAQQA